MDNSTHLTKKNRSLITDFLDKEIKKIDIILLANQSNDNHLAAYSKALYIASDEDFLLLN